MKKAFTLIELIFVIVILGILAAFAMPKLFVSRDDAEFVKAKVTVQSVRSGIALRKNTNLMAGRAGFPADLENGLGTADSTYFKGVLETPVNGRHWANQNNRYFYSLKGFGGGANTANSDAYFDYNATSGSFTCTNGGRNTRSDICAEFN